MDENEARQCKVAILSFMKNQGEEKVKAIEKQSQEEHLKEKGKFIQEEKDRIVQDYTTRLA